MQTQEVFRCSHQLANPSSASAFPRFFVLVEAPRRLRSKYNKN